MTNDLWFGHRKSYCSSPWFKMLHALVLTCTDGSALQKVEQIKLLGVQTASALTFKVHIDYVIKNVNFSAVLFTIP